jgi:hypothetical protein
LLGALFRIYSYLYHLLLALFLFGIAAVAVITHIQAHPGEGGGPHLSLGMLPWTGHTLIHWLLGASLFGLLSILLAWMGKLRFLFLLYALALFGMMFRGYFLGGYVFSGKDEFRMAIWLTAGALVAIMGAWSQFRKTPKPKRR